MKTKDDQKSEPAGESGAQNVETPVDQYVTDPASQAAAAADQSAGNSSDSESEPIAVKAAPEGKSEADEKYMRLLADFDNFRKRTLRERKDLFQRANEELIEELLPVLDHLELALAAAEAHKADRGVVDGFKILGEQMLSVFKKFGLTTIESSGGTFDPAVHEAISHLPSDTIPENGVITQVRRGYSLGGKMLRAAQVVVSRGVPQAAENPVPAQEGK